MVMYGSMGMGLLEGLLWDGYVCVVSWNLERNSWPSNILYSMRGLQLRSACTLKV